MTNRETGIDVSSLRYNDFIIRYDSENRRIIVLSPSDAGVNEAIGLLCSSGVDASAKTLRIPNGEGLVYHAQYATDSFKIDGIDIRDFAVDTTGSKAEQKAALTLIKAIQQSTGYTLSTDLSAKAYAIRFEGDENAAASYTVRRDGNHVVVTGNGPDGTQIAARLFVAVNCRYNSKDITSDCRKNVELSLGAPVSYSMAQIADLPAVSVYLSIADGCDANDGTVGAPLSSFGKASALAGYYSERATVPIQVILRGGDYYVDKTVNFGGNNTPSGTASAPIVYMAAKGEQVRFVGGLKIPTSDMVDAPVDIRERLIDSTAAGQLKMIDLSRYVTSLPAITSRRDQTNFPTEVYMNGLALELARWPNDMTVNVTGDGESHADGYLRHVSSVSSVGTTVGNKTTYSLSYRSLPSTRFYRVPTAASADASRYVYRDDASAMLHSDLLLSEISIDDLAWERFTYWSEETKQNLWMFAYANVQWRDENLRVIGSAEDSTGKYLYAYGSDDFTTGVTNSRYFFFNVLEEIDLPGECYIDRENLKIYFYPDENVTDLYISTTTDTMFNIEHAAYIGFQNIDFCFSRGRAFSVGQSHDITLDGCRIYALSSNAVNIDRSTDITVLNCDIYNTCGGGVNITECGNRRTLSDANILLCNNYFSDTARLKRTYTGSVLIAGSCGITVRGNTITDCPHEVIGISQSNNVTIEYNEISHAVYDCGDAAAIYWGRDPSTLGYVIRYNYFHDIGNKYIPKHSNAIYSDDRATGAEIYGNIFYRAGWPNNESGAAIYGRTNFEQIYNNYFVQCYVSAYVSWHMSGAGSSMPQQFKRVITSRGLNKTDPGILASTLESETLFYREVSNSIYVGSNWYQMLADAGFYNSDGSLNPIWQEYYRDTIWAPMWEQYSLAHYQYVDNLVLRHVNAWREENNEAPITDYGEVKKIDLIRVMADETRVIDRIQNELHAWCIQTVGVTNHFYGNLNLDPATAYRAQIGTTYRQDSSIQMYYDNSPVNGNIISRDNLTLDSNILAGGGTMFTEYSDGGGNPTPDFRLTAEGKAYLEERVDRKIDFSFLDNCSKMGVQGREISAPAFR